MGALGRKVMRRIDRRTPRRNGGGAQAHRLFPFERRSTACRNACRRAGFAGTHTNTVAGPDIGDGQRAIGADLKASMMPGDGGAAQHDIGVR